LAKTATILAWPGLEGLAQFFQRLSCMTNLDPITSVIIRNAIRIHRELGPGLLESVYDELLTRAIRAEGLHVDHHPTVAFEFDGIAFKRGLCPDLIIEHAVVVELKSVERLAPVHSMQVLTYLRLTKLQLGLLINFGGRTLREGLRRIVNHLPPVASPSLAVNKDLPKE
jgi:iron complex transport system substrate-binding protein